MAPPDLVENGHPAIAVCFSPEEDCTALAVDAIDRSETQILVSAYGLTTSSRVVEALIQARGRGVDVHTQGKGIAGTYTFEVAEQKQYEVLLMAKIEEHPLRVEVERA